MKRTAIALAIMLVFTTFSYLPFSTIADEPTMIGDGMGISDIPERTDDGFFIENLGQWNDELLFVGDTSFGQIGLGRGRPCVSSSWISV